MTNNQSKNSEFGPSWLNISITLRNIKKQLKATYNVEELLYSATSLTSPRVKEIKLVEFLEIIFK